MALEDVAAAHYEAQQAIVRTTAEQAQALWQEVTPAAVIQQWMALLAQIVELMVGGQIAAARLATPYLRAVAREQGSTRRLSLIVPEAFAGRGADGRELPRLLMQPALRTAGLVARGADDADALRSGLASLLRIVTTEVPDAGRTAVGAGIVANKQFVTYVRMLTLPSCGRCIVLAGRQYAWSDGFLRHPNCDCYHLPVVHDGTGDLPGETPDQVFERLTRQQQDAAFGKDAAEAIRAGGDIGQVVNARRGVYTAGGREFTRAGTSRRGRARGQQRPTPEQIMRDNADDRTAAIEQLRQYGYLRS